LPLSPNNSFLIYPSNIPNFIDNKSIELSFILITHLYLDHEKYVKITSKERPIPNNKEIKSSDKEIKRDHKSSEKQKNSAKKQNQKAF